MLSFAQLWDLVDRNDLANPFHRLGTDDPKRIGGEFPLVEVGLVNSAMKALAPTGGFDFSASLHILLVAPLGGGKSATIRRLARACSDHGGIAAVVKLEQQQITAALVQQGAEACAVEVIAAVVRNLAHAIAKKSGNTTPFEERVRQAEAKLERALHNVPVQRLLAQLALTVRRQGLPGGLIELDEAEAVLVATEVSLEQRIRLLEIFKNWCEETDATLSLVIAGTNAVLDVVREKVPKVLDGRLMPVADYSLDVDDVEHYLNKKITYGGTHQELFALLDSEAIDWIASASRGVPRRLERLCHSAWTLARSDGAKIDRSVLRHAIAGLAGSQLEASISGSNLPKAEKRAARILARNGLSSDLCRELLPGSEYSALYRLARRSIEPAIVERRARGSYEIADGLLREAFNGGS